MTAPTLIPNTALTDKVHAMCKMAQGILCTLEQAAVIIYKFSVICWKQQNLYILVFSHVVFNHVNNTFIMYFQGK